MRYIHFFAIKIAKYFKLVIHMKILNAKSKFAKLYKLFVFKSPLFAIPRTQTLKNIEFVIRILLIIARINLSSVLIISLFGNFRSKANSNARTRLNIKRIQIARERAH